ncbi:MAG: S-layer homology domain-containing protein [Clostridiales bacterium]|nr:S-layer homology domain-containing protein [Clostridiales bacterium]
MKKVIMIICICLMLISSVSFGEESLETPVINSHENMQGVDFADVTIKWQSCVGSEYYLLKVVDTVGNVTIVDNVRVDTTEYTIPKSLIEPRHMYEVSVAAVRGSEEVWGFINIITLRDFSTITKPSIRRDNSLYTSALVDQYFIWDFTFGEGIDTYLVSVKDETDGKFIIYEEKVSSNYYTIDKKYLSQNKQYRFIVTAVKGPLTSSDQRVFYINAVDVERPVIRYPMDSSIVSAGDLKVSWNYIHNADYYLVSVADLTDNMYIVHKYQTNQPKYEIQGSFIIPGHQYEVSFCSVINGLEKWNQSRFSVRLPAIEYPSIEGISKGEVVSKEGHRIRWQPSEYIDNYELVLRDTTTDQIIIQETIQKPYYDILQTQLSFGHEYKLVVTTVRDDKSKMREIDFSVEAIELTAPEAIGLKAYYAINDVKLHWKDIYGVDKYSLTIQDLDTRKIILNNVEFVDSSYIVDQNILTDGHRYRLVLTALNATSQKSMKHDFTVSSDPVLSPEATTDISSWAQSYVEAVKEKEVLESVLLNTLLEDPQASLTRVEFCEMLVALYDSFDQHAISVDMNKAKQFLDISHLTSQEQTNIKKANALGIISGTSETTFNPDGFVTRQEMSVMLKNAYTAIVGSSTEMDNGLWKDSFADKSLISPWAVESVRFINSLDILNGDGTNFNPKDLATHEMGFVLLEKSMKKFIKK